VQLPPSLEFNARVARPFFAAVRDLHAGAVVCEPRHASWFDGGAEAVMQAYRVARVATDPSRIPAALVPGGWMGPSDAAAIRPVVYYRLHGSPRKYWSRYEPDRLQRWADALTGYGADLDAWCIFDNTASGAAAANALEMVRFTTGA
jgi:uncharacterized protein YecE (DUF72 family)